MRCTVLMVIAALLLFPLSGLSQTVNYSGKDVPLRDIFTVIKNQTGVFFFYDSRLLEDSKSVSVEWKNVTLQNALNDVFRNQSLTWVLENKTVTVIRKPISNNTNAVKESPPPSIRVQGNISDEDGNPLPAVSVMIKGTEQGTTSNDQGRFSIYSQEKNTLVFSSVNYISKEVRIDKTAMNIRLELAVKPMEALLVGGNLTARKRKAEANTITVLDAKTLEKIPGNTLDQVFRGWVPGTYSINFPGEPEGYPALNIRGVFSGELSTIAVYVDGIEYAGGAGYLFQLDKNNIERIEIVKGPGAATLYGTGSNGGIVQIFTKKPKENQTTVSLTTSAGFYKSKWVKQDPFQQMHNIETRTGFKNMAITLGGSYRTVGAYLPEGGEKNKGFYGSAGFNLGKLHANISSRYNVRNFHYSRDPTYDTALNPRRDIIIEPFPGYIVPAYEYFGVMPSRSANRDGITETSVTAMNLSHRSNKNWVNNLDAGFTTNNLRQVPAEVAPLQSQYRNDKKNILTFRYSNVFTLLNGVSDFALSITSGVEYKKYTSSLTVSRPTAPRTIYLKEPDNNNYGAFIQANPSYKNVYLTAAMRYEKNATFTNAWNPRLGLTTNFDIKSATIKPRISWGRGITNSIYEYRFGLIVQGIYTIHPNRDIQPQSQQGFDYGLEVYDKKGRYKLEAVYYDNVLKNIFRQGLYLPLQSDTTQHHYIWSNAGGKYLNKGWEFSGEFKAGPFSFRGILSIMNTSYSDTTGGQVFKEKIKGPPTMTTGLNLDYQFAKLFGKSDKGLLSLQISKLDGIVLGRRDLYALDVAYGRKPFNPNLFGYNVENPPLYRVGLYADYDITNELRFFVQGANILNEYTYELTGSFPPTHGANWLFGLKYNFSKSPN